MTRRTRPTPAPTAARRGRAGGFVAGRRAGMTLAELSISLGVIATLMVATGSIMVLTGRAIAVTSAHASEARIDDVVQTLVSDQRLALTVTERTATSVTFTIADRNGDGAPETIKYTWSGVKGDPLTRSVNGLTPVVVARDVQRFNLGYITKTSAPAVAEVESAEDVIYTQAAGTSFAAVSSTVSQAQSFKKTFPANTTTWRITSVRLNASRPSGTTGSWLIGVYKDAGGKPGLLPEFEEAFAMTGLTSTPAERTFTFSKIDQNLDKSLTYWVVVKPQLLNPAPVVAYNAASPADGGQMLSSTVLGWGTASPTRDLNITVKGRYKYLP